MNQYSTLDKLKAWSVHALTASGIVLGFMSILAIADGDFRASMLWLAAALFVDGIDGTFARLFKVKKVLPHINGSNMDYVIDFATYAIIPAYFIYECGVLPDDFTTKIIAISFLLITSSFYYGKNSYVTDDMHFEGFPVLWNVVAYFMFFIFEATPWVNFAWIIVFSLLHFAPLKFLYPSRTKSFQLINIAFSSVGTGLGLWYLYIYPEPNEWLRWGIIICLSYFVFMVFYKTYFYKEKA